VDLVAPQSDPRLLQDVVYTASMHAAADADALICLHIGTALSNALGACGFFAREPERYLLADPGGLGEGERELLLAERSWFVTQGDSDIDRP
jgi:hypothetical protein